MMKGYRRLLCLVTAVVMLFCLAPVGVAAEETVTPTIIGNEEDPVVAKLAGKEIYFTQLADAFTLEYNPDNTQVIMLTDVEQDVVVSSGGYYSFYLNGYTLTGMLKITNGQMNLYGALAGTTTSTNPSVIRNTGIDGNYPVYFNHANGGSNFYITGCTIEATAENGTAIYADGQKVYIRANTVVNGNLQTFGNGNIQVSAGTFTGSLIEGEGSILNIYGGTFSADPSDFLSSGHIAKENDEGRYEIAFSSDATIDDLTKDESGAYLIRNKEELLLFRLLINNQTPSVAFGGKVFKLTDNVDLSGMTLGLSGDDSHRFGGTFDGQGHTISNMTIAGGSNKYVAFFGETYGATIQNITFHNVTVTGGQYTAAVVGYSRTSATTLCHNCHVTGAISITGTNKAAVLAGGGRLDITQCSIDGNGTVAGTFDIGGLIGLASAGTQKLEGNRVSGLTIDSGSGIAAGLAGRVIVGSMGLSVQNNTLNNVTVNVAQGASYGDCAALFVGSTTADDGNAVYLRNYAQNSAVAADGIDSAKLYNTGDYGNSDYSEKVSTAAMLVDSAEFVDLQEAIDAADGKTVTLLKDVALTEALTVAAGKSVVLDLNGKTISQTKEQTAAYSMITNHGNLTITDSGEGGTISYIDSGNGGNYVSNTIQNNGALVVNGGTIINSSSEAVGNNGFPHAIDTKGKLTVSGGIITCEKYSAIRIWCDADNVVSAVNILGGEINGAVDFHNVNNDANKGELIIEGGTFNQTVNKNVVRMINYGTDLSQMRATISGGVFNGGIGKTSDPSAKPFAYGDVFHIIGGQFAAEPPCTAEGYAGDAMVGTYYVVHQHDSYKMEILVPPSCKETGKGNLRCSVCDTVMTANVTVPTIAHTEVTVPGKAATCTETGLTDGKKCSVCDAVTLVQEEIAKKEHKLEPVEAKEATYFAAGNTAHYHCAGCKKLFADADGKKELNAADVVIAQLVKVEGTTADVDTTVVEKALKEAETAGKVDVVINVTKDELAENPELGDDAVPDEEQKPAPVVTKTELPVAAVVQVADLHEDATLTISMTNATVTMDKTTLEVVAQQAKAEETDVIAMEIKHIEAETLTPEQQKAVEDKEIAAVISASILLNEKELHDFKSGKVKVAIPFEPAEGTKGEDYVVLYIADDGTIEQIPSVYKNGTLEMTLSHFSEYVVVNSNVTVSKDPTNPGTGDGFQPMVMVVVMMTAAALAVLMGKKRFAK